MDEPMPLTAMSPREGALLLLLCWWCPTHKVESTSSQKGCTQAATNDGIERSVWQKELRWELGKGVVTNAGKLDNPTMDKRTLH